MATVLAIDQGTTSTKAFLLSQDGTFHTVGSVVHRQILPGPGMVEHDANELLAAIDALIDAALDLTPDIAAIALANQGETVVAWDKVSGAPLYNAIVWQDQRTQTQLDQLSDTDRQLVLDRAGLPCDAYFSAAKLNWLLREVPEVARTARAGRLGLGTSDAFFLHRMTGAHATDVSTASRTSLMTLATCQWDAELCRVFDLPLDVLPPIQPSTGAFGQVTRQGRAIPIMASLVDQQAALFGHGCRNRDEAKITFGTGSFALSITGERPALPHHGLMPTVAWQRQGHAPVYALEAGDYTAAAAVDWCRSVGLGGPLDDFRFADPEPAILRGLAFVPALAGLAAPYWRRDATAAFVGLTQSTTSADMRKAVLEGVALRGADLVDLIAPGTAPISVDGGLARNDYFLQFLANLLGRPVRLPKSTDLTGLGAALLAFDALALPVAGDQEDGVRIMMPDTAMRPLGAARAYFQAAIWSMLELSKHHSV
jgi:glycerol kinase